MKSSPINSNKPKFSWYPGHMLKAEREVKKILSLIDVIVEVADARAPRTSRNHRILEIIQQKPYLLILNKDDLVEANAIKQWKSYFTGHNVKSISVNKHSRKWRTQLIAEIENVVDLKNQQKKLVNTFNKPNRVMILGMPNVGKSTIINCLSNNRKMKVGAVPGVTRQQQWIKLSNKIDLLDTPGIMMPRIDSTEAAFMLGLLAIVRDNLIDHESLAEFLFNQLSSKQIQYISTHYNLDLVPSDVYQLLGGISTSNNLLKPGGEADVERSTKRLLHEFKKGLLGKISLEFAP